MNDTAKSVSRSVSMPEELWEVTDAHAKVVAGDRSVYIRKLVTVDLEAAGKLPCSPTELALIEAKVTVDILGPEAAREEFRAARERRAQEVAP